jgi:hypothetical protein
VTVDDFILCLCCLCGNEDVASYFECYEDYHIEPNYLPS